ncbi:MAG TPA: hypothetical protein VNT51_13770 [Miltoncostaeaceae bacterium]|nr:hypothetical protein [Miltoncostaeaceae bacterium]
MGDPDARLAALLEETARAHHDAFAATDGEDPEWPAWYAQRLVTGGLEALVGGTPDAAAVETELRASERAHAEEAPDTPWSAFYAARLRRRLAPSA